MIFKHELKTNYKSLLIWSLAISGTNFCFMLMYPSLQDSMRKAMDAYSNMGALTAAFGMDKLSMATALGFYGVYVGAILSLGGAMFAAMLGTGILSKEEGGHTSEFLYTLPFTRNSVVAGKTAAVMLMIIIFNIISFLFGILSFPIINAVLPLKEVLIFHIGQLAMQAEVGAICVLLSACSKKVSLGSGFGIAMLFYFLDMMARVLSPLKFAKYITPFYYANAADVMVNGRIDILLLFIGMVIAALCIGASIWYYNKRDLAA